MYSALTWISASIVEQSLLYPLDVAVTRRQTSPIYTPARSASRLLTRLFTNRSLYNGLVPHIACHLPLLSYRYIAAEYIHMKQYTLPISALIGAIIGAVEGVIITPFEAVKIPMQISDCRMPLRDGLKTITKNGTSYRSLFRGLIPTVARQSVYGSVTFSAVQLLADMQDRDIASGASHLAVSNLISAIAVIIGSPLDVIKSRSQSLAQFPSITKRHLFAGLSIKLWRVTLGTTTFMIIYDQIARFPNK